MVTRTTLVRVERTGRVLAVADLADTALTRMRGLLGRDELAGGAGLILAPCNLIHTWFMRFTIDVLFLDRAGVVVARAERLEPFGIAWGGWRARTTIELPAGSVASAGVVTGDHIRLEAAVRDGRATA